MLKINFTNTTTMHKFIYLIIYQEKCWHLYLPELTLNWILNFMVLNLYFELPKFKKEKQLCLEFLQASTAKTFPFILRRIFKHTIWFDLGESPLQLYWVYLPKQATRTWLLVKCNRWIETCLSECKHFHNKSINVYCSVAWSLKNSLKKKSDGQISWRATPVNTKAQTSECYHRWY